MRLRPRVVSRRSEADDAPQRGRLPERVGRSSRDGSRREVGQDGSAAMTGECRREPLTGEAVALFALQLGCAVLFECVNSLTWLNNSLPGCSPGSWTVLQARRSEPQTMAQHLGGEGTKSTVQKHCCGYLHVGCCRYPFFWILGPGGRSLIKGPCLGQLPVRFTRLSGSIDRDASVEVMDPKGYLTDLNALQANHISQAARVSVLAVLAVETLYDSAYIYITYIVIHINIYIV